MEIKLFDYQQKTIQKMRELFSAGKRLAAAILPTGAGKSFVAMQAILDEVEIPEKIENGVVSDKSIYYFAPNDSILYQFKLHIAQNILSRVYLDQIKKDHGLQGEISEENIESYIRGTLMAMGLKTDQYNELSPGEIEGFTPEEIVLKTVRKNIVELGLEKCVEKALPNMRFECYQGLTEEKANGIKADFFVLDEAHRTGAKTWKKALNTIMNNNKSAKYLAITATPERDMDDENFLQELALKTGYSEDEALHNKFYAGEIYLLDAMRDGKVVTPKVMYFPWLLDETKEYMDVFKKYLSALKKDYEKSTQSTTDKIEGYKIILTQMHKAMGMDEAISDSLLFFGHDFLKSLDIDEIESVLDLPNRSIWERIKQEKTEESLGKVGETGEEQYNPDGKYICFVPKASGGKTAKDVVEHFKEKVRKMFKKCDISYMKAYHSSVGEENQNGEKEKHEDILREFSAASTDEGGLKIIFTNQKAQEGFHPDGVSGEIFFEEIGKEKGSKKINGVEPEDPRIAFLQKIGRVVFGIQGKKETEYDVPVIFDFKNNFGRQKDTLIKGGNLFKIPSSIQYFYDWAEIGRKGFKGFRHLRYRDSSEETCIFNMIGDKGERKIQLVNPEEYNPYVEERQETIQKYEPKKVEDRFKLLKNVLKELRGLNIDYTKIDDNIVLNRDFLVRSGATEEQITQFYNELIKAGFKKIDEAEYDLGKEYDLFKKAFWKIGKGIQKYSSVYKSDIDYEELVAYGILNINLEEIPEELREKISPEGFIKPHEDLPESAIGINIHTGTRFYQGKDEYRCFEDGRNEFGFDRHGFNDEGYHYITGEKYDQRGFYLNDEGKWINRFTGKETDALGYNHEGINPETGFDRGQKLKVLKGFRLHLWHKKNDDGTFSRIGTEYNDSEPPHDFHYFGKSKRIVVDTIFGRIGSKIFKGEFFKDGTSEQTGEKRNYSGLDMDGIDRNGFSEENGYNIYTSSKYDRTGKNINGVYPSFVQNTNEILRSILKGKSQEEILEEFGKNAKQMSKDELAEYVDKMILGAYNHYLTYKKPMNKEKALLGRLHMLTPEQDDILTKLSPKLKTKMDRMADMKRKALEYKNMDRSIASKKKDENDEPSIPEDEG